MPVLMRRVLIVLSTVVLACAVIPFASAHQPVELLDTDTSAKAGPLLVDGTISFAIRASFTKSGQKKAFRAALKEGDQLDVQYLIVDKKPENALKNSQLPQLVITSPTGKKFTIKINERSPFYEPYGGTNYFYLARYSAPAEAGIYQFLITSRAKAGITIAVGEKEIRGEVVRGPAPVITPTPTASPTATTTPAAAKSTPEPTASSTPKAEATVQSGYTMANVKANNSESSCWSVISGNVYNLTQWINSHPGGPSRIRALCGTDGTSSFNAQHAGRSTPISTLANYLLGPLAK
ncbi:MAG: cytochrome b5-like heme/steroid binding domain-containing protein [Actinobacteria bacterium]|nr:cytochrome b5-like heme/steroid binding domain-containing protein [Actinomycetota bacterium]